MALIERGSNGGSCQFRSRSSFKPWNRPQSTSTRVLPVSIKYFDPVTVPTPPQNEILAKRRSFSENHPQIARKLCVICGWFDTPKRRDLPLSQPRLSYRRPQ